MRFHVLGLPHTQTTKEYSACAFTEKVRKFCVMMKSLGHEVFLYAGDQNEAPCDELITCVTEHDRAKFVGDKSFVEASFDYKLPHWRRFNSKIITGLKARLQQKDFICSMSGLASKEIADYFPNHMFVEFGIGYGGNFAKYRVWESYAWMHTCYGAQNGNPNAVDGQWFDEVIPGYFEPELFTFKAEKQDYYLFIGRLTERKGYRIAMDVCKELGTRLVVAGQGVDPGEGVDFRGIVGPAERNELMSNARATFVPTQYIEPFGNVAVESMYCGTPVICTDWGAMTETVKHAVTGFRCRSFKQFLNAAKYAHYISPVICHRHARDNYSLDVIRCKYEAYFNRLLTLWGDGWYDGRNSNSGDG